VIGASGGAGPLLHRRPAKAFGAEVTGVASEAKVDLVRSLGADHVIDYSKKDFAAGDRRYDVVLDIGGSSAVTHLRRALTPKGRLVIVGGMSDGHWFGGIDRQVRAQLLSPFVGQKLGTFVASENAGDLTALRELIDAGKVTPAIERAYPLAEVPAAIRHLLDGAVRGKVVITV
jgi:NADPH:quinone reductase-like Zn-dependent oxidoreductase